MNVIVRLEYELAYNDSAVHRFNYYTTRRRRRIANEEVVEEEEEEEENGANRDKKKIRLNGISTFEGYLMPKLF